MKEFQNRQKFRNFLYSPVSLILLLIIAFFIIKGTVNLILKEHESAVTLSALQQGNQDLKARQSDLQGEIQKLGTQEGVEQEVRSKFNATKPGEHLAVIIDGAQGTATPQSTIERLKEGWTKFLNLLHFW